LDAHSAVSICGDTEYIYIHTTQNTAVRRR